MELHAERTVVKLSKHDKNQTQHVGVIIINSSICNLFSPWYIWKFSLLKTFTYEVCTHTRKIAKQHCVLIGVTGWFLFKANWENFQIYHGENKLHIDEVMMITPTCLVWFLSCLLNLTTVRSACSSIRIHYPDSEQTILALSSLMSLELCV
jgi:hypothetical protein